MAKDSIKVGDTVAITATIRKRVTEDRVSVLIPTYNQPHSIVDTSPNISSGQKIELTGEVLKAADRDTAMLDIPSPVGSAMSWLGFLPGAPLTRDQWLMLQTDNVASPGSNGLDAFGMEPTPLGAVAPLWLGQYGGSRFARRRVNLTATN